MIPQIIHYCWFGRNPLPELAQTCIASWKKYLPGYEIKEWNEDNFDVNMTKYTSEAYKLKKYAFVSDFARYWILYNFGGLYFDTDVEVIKPLDDIISRGAFMGCENSVVNNRKESNDPLLLGVNPGLGLGVCPGHLFFKQVIGHYQQMSFILKDGGLNQVTIVDHTTELLVQNGLKYTTDIQCVGGIWIYPKEYFCPIDYETGALNTTDNTRTIHHYSESWLPWYMKAEGVFWQKMGYGKKFFLTRVIFRIQKYIRAFSMR